MSGGDTEAFRCSKPLTDNEREIIIDALADALVEEYRDDQTKATRMKKLISQEDFESSGLLPLRDVLNDIAEVGWQYDAELFDSRLFVRLSAENHRAPNVSASDFGRLVAACSGAQIERLFCDSHHGGDLCGGRNLQRFEFSYAIG